MGFYFLFLFYGKGEGPDSDGVTVGKGRGSICDEVTSILTKNLINEPNDEMLVKN